MRMHVHVCVHARTQTHTHTHTHTHTELEGVPAGMLTLTTQLEFIVPSLCPSLENEVFG